LGIVGIGLASIAIGLAAGRRDSRIQAVDPAAHFPPEHRENAQRYTGLKLSYWAAGSIIKWGALAAIVGLGGGTRLSALARRLARGRRYPTVFLAAALLLVFLAVATLPLAYQSGHRAERAFGLTSQSPGGWLLDWSRQQGFWIGFYSAVAAGFLVVLDRWPRRGWVGAAAAGIVLAVAGTFLAPRLIDPLFYDFAPLEDRPLARDIEELGARAGIEVQRVMVMDASGRTNRLNAYITGLGATRQVVLYDNLLERAPREEVRLVVAHEIGHAAAHHVPRGLLWSLPVIVLGTCALAALARLQARERGLDGPGDPAGFPLLWLALSLALFVSSPAMVGIARGMETDADWASIELTRDPETYVALQKRLAVSNLAPIEPPRWVVFWFNTHPPILDRIGMAAYWSARNR
jgi:STE24 endopeptidase